MSNRDASPASRTALGAALFVAAGSVVFCAADRRAQPQPTAAKAEHVDLSLAGSADQLGKAFASVAAHVMPAVVGVSSEKRISLSQQEMPFPFGGDFFRQFFGGSRRGGLPQGPHQFRGEERGLGSGMILDRAGHVLTNYHVIRDVDEITVELPEKRKFQAVVVGTDPHTDVAVVRLKGAVPSNLATIELGDSDALQVGNLVEAIGAPFGLLQTVTQGIISATGRSDVGIADYEDFLQTDAAINPGNSGGPLVNMHGEVIGMNSAIATSMGQFAGVGFAIPSSMIRAMLPKLIKGEKIIRGQLGVLIQDVTPNLAKEFGLSEPKGSLVSQVNKDSPAEKAGVKPGDIIVRFGDKEVGNTRQLRNMVASTAPNTKTTVSIVRSGKQQSLPVTVGAQANEGGSAMQNPQSPGNQLSRLGIDVQNLTPGLARELGLQAQEGVVIVDVEEGSLALLAGLQKADVIVEADRKRITKVSDLEQALAKVKDSGQVLLRVIRQGNGLFVVVAF
jgi:serine protease Do